MKASRGRFLLLLAAFVPLAVHLGRAALPREEPPAFFVEKRTGIFVGLENGSRPGKIHQFPDGTTLKSVIEMADLSEGREGSGCIDPEKPVQDGEAIKILRSAPGKCEITRSWLPAGQRIALGIPLHPDRMRQEDWEVLPGIGPRLAEAVEKDRQFNGDFGSLEALDRVRGIGPKRIDSWREFF